MIRVISVIKQIAYLFMILLSKCVLSFVPKDKNLILFSSWFGEKYADNSMYMFEFFYNNHFYKPVWYTINKDLYKQLVAKRIPVVYGNSLKGYWTQIRAKMLVSSIQHYDFNMLLYRKCIFFDLDHGYALKQVGLAIPGATKLTILKTKFIRSGMDFWMSAPSSFSMEKVKECYKVEKNKIVHCNKPRIDALFCKDLQDGKNTIIDKIKAGRKAIVWMPTHRNDGNMPINVKSLLDLERLQQLCEDYNFVFIIKKHFYHKKEVENLSSYSNIYDVTQEELDSQVILAQADALISDYSSSYIEYLILDRPIILYAYDIHEYLDKERGLYIPFEQNTAGEKVYSSNELLNSISRIAYDWSDSDYAAGRAIARNLYFSDSVPKGHYREEVKEVIDSLMKGTYKPDWG